jgi:CheY-like chemotaxis protein
MEDRASLAGDALFEAFVEQVKQALEHLYDFAYLQQHPLARNYDGKSDLSAKTAGRQLRYELVTAIESLKPPSESHFRAPDARLYNMLHMYYVESLAIQEVATELGLSERQAYRDLKRGQETVAAILWNNQLPPPALSPEPDSSAQEFSLQTEVARLRLEFSLIDVGELFQEAQSAVERLTAQQSVHLAVDMPPAPLPLSTDPTLGHQVILSVLSYAIQQAQPGVLSASFESSQDAITLTLRYRLKDGADSLAITKTAITKLAQRLQWEIADDDLPDQQRQLVLRMISGKASILVIDDNDGWIGLLERFLEEYNCLVVPSPGGQDCLQQARELNPSAIILDVMMPQKDGWDLLQRLRAQPATAQTPIIVCTVFNDPQLAYSLGASAFLSKPANREEILRVLEQLNVI